MNDWVGSHGIVSTDACGVAVHIHCTQLQYKSKHRTLDRTMLPHPSVQQTDRQSTPKPLQTLEALDVMTATPARETSI